MKKLLVYCFQEDGHNQDLQHPLEIIETEYRTTEYQDVVVPSQQQQPRGKMKAEGIEYQEILMPVFSFQ